MPEIFNEMSGTAPPVDPMRRQMQLMERAYRELPLADAERATIAAMQFQGRRGYLKDVAAGKSPEEAMAKWGSLLFIDKPTSAVGAAQIGERMNRPMNIGGVGYQRDPANPNQMRAVTPLPKPASVEEVTMGGVPYIRTTQPSGSVSHTRNLPQSLTAKDPVETALRSRLLSAQRAHDTASAKAFPATQTQEQVKTRPAWQIPPWKTVTNQVPVMSDQGKAQALLAAQAGASNTMAGIQRELEQHVSQKRPMPSNAQPAPQPELETPNPYIVGRRYGKLRYKGGDPTIESNWERVK